MGTLFVVSTPIGNMKDISMRAVEALFTLPVLLCEDTRRTGSLLKKLEEEYCHNREATALGRQRLVSFFEGNEDRKLEEALSFLKEDLDVGLVSDAGTPLVSDPGYKLVRECLNLGIKVVAIPGPSALLAALVISGMPPERFLFMGYLPRKPGKQKKILESLAEAAKILPMTVVFYLTPHRLVKELMVLEENLGDVEIALGSELTKLYEKMERGKISELISKYGEKKVKGELTAVLRLGN